MASQGKRLKPFFIMVECKARSNQEVVLLMLSWHTIITVQGVWQLVPDQASCMSCYNPALSSCADRHTKKCDGMSDPSLTQPEQAYILGKLDHFQLNRLEALPELGGQSDRPEQLVCCCSTHHL